jgi:RNA polymerase sigma-70 factor, ECF subfamily
MEEELIEASRRGNVDAFAGLIERYTPDVYAFIGSRAPHDLVADLAQETFLRAWRSIGGFRGACSFRFWLFRIAVNLTASELKRRGRVAPWSGDADHAEPTAQSASDELEAQAERHDLHSALTILPDADRELVQLLYRDQLSYEEIALATGMPLGTVKVRLFRARQRLRAHLEELWEG